MLLASEITSALLLMFWLRTFLKLHGYSTGIGDFETHTHHEYLHAMQKAWARNDEIANPAYKSLHLLYLVLAPAFILVEAVLSGQNPVRKELARDATVLKPHMEHCGNSSSTRLACPCWSAIDIPHKKSASPFCACKWTEVFFFFTPGTVVIPVSMEGCRVGVLWVLQVPHPFWEWFRAQEPCLW